MDDVMEAVGLCPIKENIQIWKGTIAAQVACRPIYELCTGEEWMLGSSQMMRWWDQDMGREEE